MVYYDNLRFKNELQYEVHLLNEYLVKHYDDKTSDKLLNKYSGNLDTLAKALGEFDIAFFCLYFMSNIFVVKDTNTARALSAEHYNLWSTANDIFINDKYDKCCIIEPRGLAKTTTFNMANSVWLHCYAKSKFTLIGAKTDNDAAQFLDSIKRAFKENKKIIDNFGLLIDKKNYTVNANEVEFTNGTYIRTVGSGTSVRGANWGGIRPTVVICDDYQSEQDILTDSAREKKYDKFLKEVEQVGDKAVYRNGNKIKQATKIIAIGTVLHTFCLMSQLSRNNDYYTILRRAIILGDGQTVEDIFESDLWQQCHDIYFDEKLDKELRKATAEQFYINHKEEMQFDVLWPEKWDCFNDLAIIYWENRKAFMSELMNDASSIGEKWFKSVKTQTKEEIEEHDFVKTMLSVDPASTTNKKSDSTNIMVGSKATNDFTYIRDIVHRKLEFNKYCEEVVKALERNLDVTHINVEKNTYQCADVIKIKELIAASPILKGKSYEWINEMQKKNKDEKISTIVDPVNNGQIIICSDCEDSKKAIDEIMDFQGQLYSVHDDAPDNLAELETKIKTIETIGKVTLLDRRSFGL
ncbi:Terminase [Clostridium neonatale]|uniref:terminase n=1 Tax=Clostridium neonatale TaxID=137838 RepID=UPI00291BFF43|nr:Terminase [Clostridium neonatale]CAI3550041.1 Terminase [Clostridium neonatale]CAI3552337.1 Terminase [Clostridium neonatale]CAI3552650.1 Terminase [Clostridium neonatale]CAI3609616.1 Terminase [Clostridium neonatale]